MKLCMIAAIGQNRELGKNGDLIWSIPEDLKFFRTKTMGSTMIMGKNTFNSLPRLLPGRKHIILSDDDRFNKEIGDSVVFYNVRDLMEFINKELKEEKEVFVIGGASMYTMFIGVCDRMYLTHIHAEDKDADVYFPEIDFDKWEKKTEYECFENGLLIEHCVYDRK